MENSREKVEKNPFGHLLGISIDKVEQGKKFLWQINSRLSGHSSPETGSS